MCEGPGPPNRPGQVSLTIHRRNSTSPQPTLDGHCPGQSGSSWNQQINAVPTVWSGVQLARRFPVAQENVTMYVEEHAYVTTLQNSLLFLDISAGICKSVHQPKKRTINPIIFKCGRSGRLVRFGIKKCPLTNYIVLPMIKERNSVGISRLAAFLSPGSISGKSRCGATCTFSVPVVDRLRFLFSLVSKVGPFGDGSRTTNLNNPK
jgi:hypothetical protein